MATYVLIAGAWHGSWCWSEVAPLLRAAGHRVLAPDLIGMGDGSTTVVDQPLATWADQLATILQVETSSVILVGHSRAGLVISEVAELLPGKVELLVYLCAFLLRNGQTLGEVAREAENAAAFGEALVSQPDGTITLADRGISQLFYNRTPKPFVEIARERTVAEPAATMFTPVRTSAERFGSVRRAYIECTHDLAIPLERQRTMQEAVGVDMVERLDSDHSPFFSMPAELTSALERVRHAARLERRIDS